MTATAVRGPVLLAAGGTGGHLFPAEALARVLAARGWRVELATDRRAETYGGDFPAAAVHVVSSATITRSLAGVVGGAWRLARGILQARRLMAAVRPAAAVGFGGYPTVPPILAAKWAGVPTVIHEQNAVMGRANRFLAPRVDRIAVSVPGVVADPKLAAKVAATGNPVRPAVRAAARTPYPARGAADPFRLLVFGGSQGARVFADLAPAAVAALPAEARRRVSVVQQCRGEDVARVTQAYRDAGIAAEVAPFFADLPQRMAASHLVVSRSGASTCAELTVIGRPAILVPLPNALDLDQTHNARVIDAAGGGVLLDQGELTAERLSALLADAIADPARLAAMAAAARGLDKGDAAERLADVVEAVAGARAVAEKGVPA